MGVHISLNYTSLQVESMPLSMEGGGGGGGEERTSCLSESGGLIILNSCIV